MGRRVRISGHPAKRRRSTARSKVRKASAGVADLREQLDRRTRELDDAHQQQMATSEVLALFGSHRLTPNRCLMRLFRVPRVYVEPFLVSSIYATTIVCEL